MREEIEGELASKGYRKAESKPDFLIAIYTNVKEKVDTAPAGYDDVTNTYFGRRIPVREYRQGTLVIDFIDSKTNKLAWRGVATDVFKESDSLEKHRQHIEVGVEKMIEKFPPQRREDWSRHE